MRLIFSSTPEGGEKLNSAQLFWNDETSLGDKARNGASESLGKKREKRAWHIANKVLNLADSFGRNVTRSGNSLLRVAEFFASRFDVQANDLAKFFGFHGFHS